MQGHVFEEREDDIVAPRGTRTAEAVAVAM